MKFLENLIPPEECAELSSEIYNTYLRTQASYPSKLLGDKLVPNSFSAYALPITEDLLLKLTPKIAYGLGKEIFPTYSYCRIYNTGAVLVPHTDREACEISLSLNISGDPWALWVDSNNPTAINFKPGDGILYPGLALTHWREPFLGASCTQVFLHWVDAHGPYASWKFDRRPNIGTAMSEKTYWGKS